jgi:Na+-transporting NADH:ubiquinone oxidoreductase subunit F
MEIFNLKIIEKKELNKEVFLIKTEKPANFNFASGQFNQWMFEKDNRLIPRSYSITSLKTDNYLEYVIKILNGGLASTFIKNDAEIGSILKTRGPFGKFINQNDENSLYVATGTGIAPIISIIKNRLKTEKTTKNLTLIFGVRNFEDLFLIEELDQLCSEFDNFEYLITLSNPTDDWNGLRGRVTEHIIDHISEKESFYLCGNPEMVKDVRKIILNQNIPGDKIKFEIF